MFEGMVIGVYGTLIVWLFSALLAIVMGVIFTSGLLSENTVVKTSVTWVVNLSRGIPTSLYVIIGGLLVIKGYSNFALPAIFPGTIDGFETVAWAIIFALAFGSSGHLAEIFVASYRSLDRATLEQLSAMGFSPWRKIVIATGECAYIGIPPTSTRMIHHLHNTAFAGLFPVVELFGSIQASASSTFRVFEITLIGCVLYILISGSIWLIFRILESLLTPQNRMQLSPARGSNA